MGLAKFVSLTARRRKIGVWLSKTGQDCPRLYRLTYGGTGSWECGGNGLSGEG